MPFGPGCTQRAPCTLLQLSGPRARRSTACCCRCLVRVGAQVPAEVYAITYASIAFAVLSVALVVGLSLGYACWPRVRPAGYARQSRARGAAPRGHSVLRAPLQSPLHVRGVWLRADCARITGGLRARWTGTAARPSRARTSSATTSPTTTTTTARAPRTATPTPSRRPGGGASIKGGVQGGVGAGATRRPPLAAFAARPSAP